MANISPELAEKIAKYIHLSCQDEAHKGGFVSFKPSSLPEKAAALYKTLSDGRRIKI